MKALEELITVCAEQSKHKPEYYHFVCFGGSTVKMLDTWNQESEIHCQHEGKKNWMTPMCENCKGTKGHLDLREYQESENSGIEKLKNKILNKIKE